MSHRGDDRKVVSSLPHRTGSVRTAPALVQTLWPISVTFQSGHVAAAAADSLRGLKPLRVRSRWPLGTRNVAARIPIEENANGH